MCMIYNIIIVIDLLLFSPPIFYSRLNKTIIYLKVTPFIAACYAIYYNYNNIIVGLYTYICSYLFAGGGHFLFLLKNISH